VVVKFAMIAEIDVIIVTKFGVTHAGRMLTVVKGKANLTAKSASRA